MFRKLLRRLKNAWIMLFMFVSFIVTHHQETRNVIERTMD